MNKIWKTIIVVIFIAIVLVACGKPTSTQVAVETTAVVATNTPNPTETPIPTSTSTPEPTLSPTVTSTSTPQPTNTVTPTPTATHYATLERDVEYPWPLVTPFYTITETREIILFSVVHWISQEANNNDYYNLPRNPYLINIPDDISRLSYEEQLILFCTFFPYQNLVSIHYPDYGRLNLNDYSFVEVQTLLGVDCADVLP